MTTKRLFTTISALILALSMAWAQGPNGSEKYFDNWTATDHLYCSGNYFDGNRDGLLNGVPVDAHPAATRMERPNFITSHPMNIETAEQAYHTVVAQAGASLHRDIHDQRVIRQLSSLGVEGAFIDNEDSVGGIGDLPSTHHPKRYDRDRDGMDDRWERSHGLNPKRDDANDYTLGGGYTNIEHFVNSLTR